MFAFSKNEVVTLIQYSDRNRMYEYVVFSRLFRITVQYFVVVIKSQIINNGKIFFKLTASHVSPYKSCGGRVRDVALQIKYQFISL
jgi:hypothetical protein